jgi:hypothetical protein
MEMYLYFADTNFSSFVRPVRVRSDVDKDHYGIEGSHASDRKDDAHLRNMILSNYFYQPRHLKYIPRREVVKTFDLYRYGNASGGSMCLTKCGDQVTRDDISIINARTLLSCLADTAWKDQ